MLAPKRRFFQLHLSTAIVLMFVAGGLIWANTKTRYHLIKESSAHGVFVAETGWPMTGFQRAVNCCDLSNYPADRIVMSLFEQWYMEHQNYPGPGWYSTSLVRVFDPKTNKITMPDDIPVNVNAWAVACNAAAVIALSLGVSFLFEWFLRRRERKQ